MVNSSKPNIMPTSLIIPISLISRNTFLVAFVKHINALLSDFYHSDVTWESWFLQWPGTQRFTRWLLKGNLKENAHDHTFILVSLKHDDITSGDEIKWLNIWRCAFLKYITGLMFAFQNKHPHATLWWKASSWKNIFTRWLVSHQYFRSEHSFMYCSQFVAKIANNGEHF